MLNKTMLSEETASTLFDMMIWLCSQYGPPKKQTVPKVINPEVPLHERHWADDDVRPVFEWAEAECLYLAKQCDMENWSVQIAPSGEKAQLQTFYGATARSPLKSDIWHNGDYPGYFVDYFGRPTFFYDPRRCVEPGYFAQTIIPRFSALKLYAKYPPQSFSDQEIDWLAQMNVCHMGLGFTLLACMQYENTGAWSPLSILGANRGLEEEQNYLFGTLLTLSAHKLTAEQIIATYGAIMARNTRKSIRPVLEAIGKQSEVLKLLRLLSKPSTRQPKATRLTG